MVNHSLVYIYICTIVLKMDTIYIYINLYYILPFYQGSGFGSYFQRFNGFHIHGDLVRSGAV